MFSKRTILLLTAPLYLLGCSQKTDKVVNNIQSNAPSTPVSIKLIDPKTSPNHINTPTLEVTGLKIDEKVSIYRSSSCTDFITSTTVTSSTMNLILPPLEDDSYLFYVQTQTSEGFSSCVGVAKYVLDTVKPLPVSITFPDNGSVVGSSASIVGTCEPGALLSFTGDITPTKSSCGSGSFSVPVTFNTGVGSRIVSASQTDPAGNISSSTTVTYDKSSADFSLAINQGDDQSDPTNTIPITFQVYFDTPIDPSSFSASDITNSGTAKNVVFSQPITSDNSSWTFTVTSIDTDGTVIPTIEASMVVDSVGNKNSASTSKDNSVTYSTARPDVTIDQSVDQPDPTTNPGISFTIVFSEAIDPKSFTASSITNSGTATDVTFADPVTEDNVTWTITTSFVGSDGTIVPSINAKTVMDAAGNYNTDSTSTDNSVTYASTGPSVTINQSDGQSDPTNSQNISFTIIFSEKVEGFSLLNIVNDGTASDVKFNDLKTDDNRIYTLTTSSIGSDGTIVLRIPADSVFNGNGQGNSDSTSDDNSVTFDTVGPTVTINQIDEQADPTNNSETSFIVVFSEPVNPKTFRYDVITNDGTAGDVVFYDPKSKDGMTWYLNTSSIGSDGTVIPKLKAGAVEDLAGNPSQESTSTDNSVTYDTTPPNAKISEPMPYINSTNASKYAFSGSCDEDGDLVMISQPDALGGITATCANGEFSFSDLDIAKLDDGEVKFSVIATDASSNSIEVSAPAIKDTVAPQVEYIKYYDENSTDSNQTPSFEAHEGFYAGDFVTLYTDMTCTTQASLPTQSTEDNIAIVTSYPLFDGSYTFFAGASDVAGNMSCNSYYSLDYVLTTDRPLISIGTLEPINKYNQSTYAFKGTCQHDGDLIDLNTPVKLEEQKCDNGNFSFQGFDVSDQKEGSVQFTVVITNEAGDQATDTKYAKKDTTDPVVKIASLPDISSENQTSYSFSGTCSEDGQVVMLQDPVIAMAPCTSGIFSFSSVDVSDSKDGKVNFTVTLDDAAGNSSKNSVVTMKDTTPPSEPVCDDTLNDATPSKTTTAELEPSDDESGIRGYQMSIHKNKQDEVLVDWADVSIDSAQITGISPTLVFSDTDGNKQYYTTSVRAVDNFGNKSKEVQCPGAWYLQTGYGNFRGVQSTSPDHPEVLNQMTPYALEFDMDRFNSGYLSHSTRTEAESIYIKEAGNYLLSLAIPLTRTDDNSGDRFGFAKTIVKVNGRPVSTGYAANALTVGRNYVENAPMMSSNHLTVLLERLSVDDVVTVETNNDIDTPEPMVVPTNDYFNVYMEYIPTETSYLSATADGTMTGGNLNTLGENYNWKTTTETPDYTIDRGNITFNQPGDYLISLNIPFQSVDRAESQKVGVDIEIDGNDQVDGSLSAAINGYISGGQGQLTSSSNYTNIFSNIRAGSTLQTVSLQLGNKDGTDTVVDGFKASLYIQKVNTSSGVYLATGNNDFDWTTENSISWINNIFYDTQRYEVEGPAIRILEDGDYMAYMSDLINSTSYANPIVQVLVNKIPYPGGECMAHNITSSTKRGGFSNCDNQIMLQDLHAGDEVRYVTEPNGFSPGAKGTPPKLTLRQISNGLNSGPKARSLQPGKVQMRQSLSTRNISQ